jgi:hypothetical protein
MPVKMQSVGKGKYMVSTPNGTKAKSTTLAKATGQKRLLNAIDHGWKPRGRFSSESIQTKACTVLELLLSDNSNGSKAVREKRPYTNWFYTNSNDLTIHTYGVGDHPTKTYKFEDEDDLKMAVRGFIRDGYKFIKDQAIK